MCTLTNGVNPPSQNNHTTGRQAHIQSLSSTHPHELDSDRVCTWTHTHVSRHASTNTQLLMPKGTRPHGICTQHNTYTTYTLAPAVIDSPTLLYVPRGHTPLAVPFTQYCPAAAVQAAEHAAAEIAPTVSPSVPLGHDVHTSAPPVLYCPTAHGPLQPAVVSPALAPYCPAGQGIHDALAPPPL